MDPAGERRPTVERTLIFILVALGIGSTAVPLTPVAGAWLWTIPTFTFLVVWGVGAVSKSPKARGGLLAAAVVAVTALLPFLNWIGMVAIFGIGLVALGLYRRDKWILGAAAAILAIVAVLPSSPPPVSDYPSTRTADWPLIVTITAAAILLVVATVSYLSSSAHEAK